MKSAKLTAKEGGTGLWAELFQIGLYKRQQGRIARQVTFVALAVAVVLGAYRLGQTIGFSEAFYSISTADSSEMSGLIYRVGLPSLIFVGGLWLCYRAVNMSRFADFLISVEAEMNKVSWPSRGELFRSSMVVLFTIIFMATVLFLFDFVWHALFRALGITN